MTREIMMLLMVISAALLTIGLSRIVILLSHRVRKPESDCMISALLGGSFGDYPGDSGVLGASGNKQDDEARHRGGGGGVVPSISSTSRPYTAPSDHE
jgi:hypothetical protein